MQNEDTTFGGIYKFKSKFERWKTRGGTRISHWPGGHRWTQISIHITRFPSEDLKSKHNHKSHDYHYHYRYLHLYSHYCGDDDGRYFHLFPKWKKVTIVIFIIIITTIMIIVKIIIVTMMKITISTRSCSWNLKMKFLQSFLAPGTFISVHFSLHCFPHLFIHISMQE